MNIDKMTSFDKDDFLQLLGLETRRNTAAVVVPSMALFGVGMLVGAGIGLLLAPKPGRELRQDIANRIQEAPEAMARLPQRATEAMHRATDAVSDKMHEKGNDAPARV